jgi:hypothetical protein
VSAFLDLHVQRRQSPLCGLPRWSSMAFKVSRGEKFVWLHLWGICPSCAGVYYSISVLWPFCTFSQPVWGCGSGGSCLGCHVLVSCRQRSVAGCWPAQHVQSVSVRVVRVSSVAAAVGVMMVSFLCMRAAAGACHPACCCHM